MLKKSLLAISILVVFNSPVFAKNAELSSDPSQDESQATQEQSADLSGPQLSSQEKSIIDSDGKQYEDELQSLHANNSTEAYSSTQTAQASSDDQQSTPPQQPTQNLAQSSQNQEQKNLQQYQAGAQDTGSQARW